jgi:predicted MFS family arabinose efflux permease
MSLCAFVLVSSEFMPVSLLTPIATDLGLSEGQAGQAISVSGFFAVVTSLFLTSLIGKLDRKILLLGLVGLLMVSGILVAFAPNFWLMMIGRACLGIAIGGYWGMSTAVIVRIAPDEEVGRAIAVLQGGSALATAVAAPMGSFLGGLIGWRGAFFCVVPLSALALAWQMLSLPALPAEDRPKGGNVFQLFLRGNVALGMSAVGFLFMGQFGLFTYLRPFLETVAHVSLPELSLMLLGIGVCGFVGTTFVGKILDRSLYSVLIAIPIAMACIAFLLLAFGAWIPVAAILLAVWGLVATPAPVGWFTWLARAVPGDTEAGGGLAVAIIQLAITLGATFGGILFDASGYEASFLMSGTILICAAGLALLTSRTRGY